MVPTDRLPLAPNHSRQLNTDRHTTATISLMFAFTISVATVPWENSTDTVLAHWPGPCWCRAPSCPSACPDPCCSTRWLLHSPLWRRLHSPFLLGLGEQKSHRWGLPTHWKILAYFIPLTSQFYFGEHSFHQSKGDLSVTCFSADISRSDFLRALFPHTRPKLPKELLRKSKCFWHKTRNLSKRATKTKSTHWMSHKQGLTSHLLAHVDVFRPAARTPLGGAQGPETSCTRGAPATHNPCLPLPPSLLSLLTPLFSCFIFRFHFFICSSGQPRVPPPSVPPYCPRTTPDAWSALLSPSRCFGKRSGGGGWRGLGPTPFLLRQRQGPTPLISAWPGSTASGPLQTPSLGISLSSKISRHTHDLSSTNHPRSWKVKTDSYHLLRLCFPFFSWHVLLHPTP